MKRILSINLSLFLIFSLVADPTFAMPLPHQQLLSGLATAQSFEAQALSPMVASIRCPKLRFSSGAILVAAFLAQTTGILFAQTTLATVAVDPQQPMMSAMRELYSTIIVSAFMILSFYAYSKVLYWRHRDFPSISETIVWLYRGPRQYAPGEKHLNNGFDKSMERLARRSMTMVLRRLTIKPELAARWDARLLWDLVQLKTGWEPDAFSQEKDVTTFAISNNLDNQNQPFENTYLKLLSQALVSEGEKRGLVVSTGINYRPSSNGLTEIRQYQFLLQRDPGSDLTRVSLRIQRNPIQEDISWKKTRRNILLGDLAALIAAGTMGVLQWNKVIDIPSWFKSLSEPRHSTRIFGPNYTLRFVVISWHKWGIVGALGAITLMVTGLAVGMAHAPEPPEAPKSFRMIRLPKRILKITQLLTHHHGDLSRMVNIALKTIDLRTVKLRRPKNDLGAFGPPVGLTIDPQLNALLEQAAHDRKCSISSLANSALAALLEPFLENPLIDAVNEFIDSARIEIGLDSQESLFPKVRQKSALKGNSA